MFRFHHNEGEDAMAFSIRRALGAAAPAGGARRSRPQAATPGLLALARAVHAAREERFRRFTADWRGAALTDLMNECAALATTFSTSAIPFPAAHEDRKADARRTDGRRRREPEKIRRSARRIRRSEH